MRSYRIRLSDKTGVKPLCASRPITQAHDKKTGRRTEKEVTSMNDPCRSVEALGAGLVEPCYRAQHNQSDIPLKCWLVAEWTSRQHSFRRFRKSPGAYIRRMRSALRCAIFSLSRSLIGSWFRK